MNFLILDFINDFIPVLKFSTSQDSQTWYELEI